MSAGNLDLTGPKQVFKAENNPWVTPIADQFQLGVSHVFEYVRSETYKYLYGRHMQANPEPPKKSNDKSKKISRKPLAAKNKWTEAWGQRGRSLPANSLHVPLSLCLFFIVLRF